MGIRTNEPISNLPGTGPATLTGQWAAKAMCNYDQQTPIVNASQNVSSVSDNSTGNYTVNFTASFAGADNIAAGMSEGSANTTYGRSIEYFSEAAGNMSFKTTDGYSSSHTVADRASSGSTISGDLA